MYNILHTLSGNDDEIRRKEGRREIHDLRVMVKLSFVSDYLAQAHLCTYLIYEGYMHPYYCFCMYTDSGFLRTLGVAKHHEL